MIYLPMLPHDADGWVYQAAAWCQYDRSCQAAYSASSKSRLLTPARSSRELVLADLSALVSRPQDRRCGGCGRPVAVKRFEIRRWNVRTEETEVVT